MQDPFKLKLVFWTQIPTFLFGLGCLFFYSQLGFHWWHTKGFEPSVGRLGLQTIVIGLMLFAFWVVARLAIWLMRATLNEMKDRQAIQMVCLALLVFFSIAAFSASKPAHLSHEGDFINYHFLLSAQPWFKGSWYPFEGNPFEFFHIVIQNGLSYLWISFPLLNKLPQFLFTCFLCLQIWTCFVLANVRNPYSAGFLALLCFLSFRGITIQVGTAMLDLVNLYFLSACTLSVVYLKHNEIESRHRSWISFFMALNIAAYLGHKSFGIVFVMVFGLVAYLALNFYPEKKDHSWLPRVSWPIVGLVLGGCWLPNVIRSGYFTGDPFYPVLPNLVARFCDSTHFVHLKCDAVFSNAQRLQAVVRHYGYGHDSLSFLKAFFGVGLAEPGGVNNKFDYPLGLFWYFSWAVLFIAPFLSRERRRFSLFLGSLAIAGFLIWFAGSQQSRWLYPVIFFLSLHWGYFWSRLNSKKTQRFILAACALFILLNGARILRSQRASLQCLGSECLKHHQAYDVDFKTPCPPEGVEIDVLAGRGYLQCPMRLKESMFSK